jgi:hypothetical protein
MLRTEHSMPVFSMSQLRSVSYCLGTLMLSLLAVACGDSEARRGGTASRPTEVTYPCEWTAPDRPLQLPRLGCPQDLTALAAQPTAAALPANRSVFFVVELGAAPTVHFFDSQRFRHFTFAREQLVGYADFSAFNAEMYYRPERRLFLGTLVHYLGPNIVAFEIAPIDKATPALIAEMFELVRSQLGWPADLRYHPTSNALEMAERLPAGVPIVLTSELLQGASYQGMHFGRSIGRVHVTSLAKLTTEYINRSDIIVIDHVPNDLPPVAGLVTGEFQTPLSHVNLLSQQRGIPNMALHAATTDERFSQHDGQWIELVVSADGFSVTPSTQAAADAFWQSQRPRDVQVPALDLSVTELTDATQIDATLTAQFGGKAANFGELTKIAPPIPVPAAFAIPCSAYDQFMRSNGLSDEVRALLEDTALADDVSARKVALASLRAHILQSPVDPQLIASVRERAEATFGVVPTRLRSSSNVEDLASFNAAGLYESHTFEPGNPDKPLDKALKRVWASLWNFGAFEEREWARIDHRAAAMGVLVHPSFPDVTEAANGVAITANPFDPPPDGQAAFYVNVQPGAVSVTNPEPGVVPEGFLYYKPPAGQGELTYLSDSSAADGARVLEFSEIRTLIKSLTAIHEHFAQLNPSEAKFGMDVEFKFVLPNRTLSIKQARKYAF